MTERYIAPVNTVERLQPEDVEEMAVFYTDLWVSTFATVEYGLDPAVERARINQRYTPEGIAEIQRATTEDMETAEKVWFVAKNDSGAIVGMAVPYRHDDDEGLQRVGALYVSEDYHGRGVARDLMNKVIEWSEPDRPLYLWVAGNNKRAQGFYAKSGFNVVEGESKVIYGKVPHIKMVRKVEV